jgi:hypothetical protein
VRYSTGLDTEDDWLYRAVVAARSKGKAPSTASIVATVKLARAKPYPWAPIGKGKRLGELAHGGVNQ